MAGCRELEGPPGSLAPNRYVGAARSLVRLRLGLLGLTALEPNGRSNFHISAWLRRASAAAAGAD
jgi:hypothetical protein